MTESVNFGMICGKDGEREDRCCVCESNLLQDTESDPLIIGTDTEVLIEQIILRSNLMRNNREKKLISVKKIT